MRIVRSAAQLGAMVAMAACLAVFVQGEASALGPTLRLPPRLTAGEVRIPKAAVQAAIERATGPLSSECKGAQAALQAYNACKDKCATSAQTAPITPVELEKCGSMSAEDCAAQLISTRAHACINAPAPTGCKDDYAKLQTENAECKNCNELKTATEKAVDATKAQAKVVAQAEAALAQARAQLAAAEAKAAALAAKTAKACADAQK